MDNLSNQNLYSNLSKTNPKSTHQGYYPPWDALALIRVWPWLKLLSCPLPLIILSSSSPFAGDAFSSSFWIPSWAWDAAGWSPKQCLTLNRAKCCWIDIPWSCGSLALFGVSFQWYNLMIRTYLDSWKFSKMMDDLSIQNLYLNFSKINPKSTHQGYPPWGALALIRVWPWIKLNIIGVIFQWYNLMIN